MNIQSLCITFTLLILISGPALAAVPQVTDYQGFLTDNSGSPIDGPTDIRIRVWNGPVESPHASVIYSELHPAVPVAKGLFSIQVGGGNTDDPGMPFTLELFEFNRWLEIEINGENLSPRKRFAATVFAFRADTAERVDNLPDDSINSAQVANEAGADFSLVGELRLLNQTDTIVRTVTISAPSSGIIIANAIGNFKIRPGNEARCGLNTSSMMNSDYFVTASSGTDSTIPFAVSRGFFVAAGDTNINLICDAIQTSPSVFVDDYLVTAIFVPTQY